MWHRSDNSDMEISTNADLLFSTTMPSVAQFDGIATGALGRGIDALMAKDYDTAVREFKRSIALSPYSDNASKAFEYMANALVSNGKTSEAIATYRQAIEVFPSADGFNLSLGNLYYGEGRYTEALDQYASAVRKNPTANQNVYSLGQGYLALGRYGEAEEQFKKIIQSTPKDSGGYFALGQTYRMEGKYDDAQEQLDKALALKKDFASVHFELGMTYAEQQQIDQAKAELAIVLEDAPQSYLELQNKIYEKSAPRVIAAYIANLKLASPPGTQVSDLNSALATPGAHKKYTIQFVFDKNMDPAAVRNIANWSINRSTGATTGGPYNWGTPIPATEISLSRIPDSVIYDPERLTAQVTFTIAQNSTGNGTIDLSHLVFKFGGTDAHGNAMDAAADEYNVISQIA